MKKPLTGDQGRQLLELARKTLSSKFLGDENLGQPDDPALLEKQATFVTLKIAGRLRGCIGNLEPVGCVWEGIRDNALNAAFHDHRFPPLQAEELAEVHVDISVLSSPIPMAYQDAEDLLAKIQPGVDGVILRDGRHRATFLPQVWEQLPTPELFLGHLCRKAGLNESAWREKKMEVLIYHVQCFEEEKK